MALLSLDQLSKAAIDPEVAKEAYAQVEKRLADLLETKKSFETRAASMLASFVSIELALMATAIALLNSGILKGTMEGLPYVLFLTAVPLVYATFTLCEALLPTHYGNLGASPEIWLQQGIMDQPISVAHMQSYAIFHMAKRIDMTEASNNAKAECLKTAAWISAATPIVFTVLFLLFWAGASVLGLKQA